MVLLSTLPESILDRIQLPMAVHLHASKAFLNEDVVNALAWSAGVTVWNLMVLCFASVAAFTFWLGWLAHSLRTHQHLHPNPYKLIQ